MLNYDFSYLVAPAIARFTDIVAVSEFVWDFFL